MARSGAGTGKFLASGKALPCRSQVPMLPRLTWTMFTPRATRRRAISSDQPKELFPYPWRSWDRIS
ncbi:MAG: hypothetical protein Ct9H300mP1_16310 [Planctomycetaceae bacterium]|nr:MAG: hypothetical protein Ct9H300mP1_16310 [Planctomycetaceae bacterium]